MKTKFSLFVLLAVGFGALSADTTYAFYAPHMGRFVNRDPAGQMPRIGASQAGSPVTSVGFVERDTFDPMANYHDGMNLYQYVESMPTNYVDADGLAMTKPGTPKPKPGPWTPWPWQIDDEAEKRRGCSGNDSDHHCWAVCMTTHFTGCFAIPQLTRFIQDAGEVCFPSEDWLDDIYANERGSKLCAFGLYDPVKYCDKQCGTNKCRK